MFYRYFTKKMYKDRIRTRMYSYTHVHIGDNDESAGRPLTHLPRRAGSKLVAAVSAISIGGEKTI